MTLVKDLNMLDNQIKDYTKLIKKANPDFIEVKGYMSVGFARQRLGYETMPTYEDIQDYAKKISKALGKPYKILNSHEFSRVILIGKNKKMMKIQKNKI
jgi:tRNA wybutosine-synthesizing protein 1